MKPYGLGLLATTSQKGVAIIMVLAVVAVLVAAVTELHVATRNNLFEAAAFRDSLTLEQMATSGIHLAMALLVKDKLDSQADSLQEDWADSQFLDGIAAQIPFEKGQVKLRIYDEMAKIQINALVDFPTGRYFNSAQYKLWDRFATRLLAMYEAEEETDPVAIINSIKDWLDSGDDDAITGLSGAESSYYLSLDQPYPCKNGPFDNLAELGLVKGITPELLAGAGGTIGLARYVTTYGAIESDDGKFTFPGKININTAELPVLAAMMPPENEAFAQSLIDWREAKTGDQYLHDLSRKDWYKDVPGFSGIDLDANLITIASDIFRIIATASIEKSTLTLSAVVQREKDAKTGRWGCRVLNWEMY